MKNRLSNISTQYRKFSKGQYIEDPDQFNEFLDFFEDQDRLSRVLLQGVGIVCGLKHELIYKNRILSGVQLSQGAAITTDGDLLTLNSTSEVSKDLYMSDLKTVAIENKKYTCFKAYDNFKIKYPAFYDKDQQIELWELATDEEAKSDFQPVSNLTDLEDKYLLLYLEDYEKEVKPCRGVDCDNHGIQQIRNLKVLVTTSKGITDLLGEYRLVYDPLSNTYKPGVKDAIQPHPLFIDGIIEPVKQERIILERFVSKTSLTVSDLKNLYIKAVEKNNYGKIVFERIEAIGKILGIPVAGYAAFKEAFVNIFNQDSGFQYAYDVVKDLMDTYAEIAELLPKAFTKAFPDFVSFPKHIMLGKLVSHKQLDSLRHQFYNSPALDSDKATQRVKVLINRFNEQVQNFNYGNIFENKGRIKITPSQKLNPLSNKAIPFYYRITEGFLKVWNFDKTGNRSFSNNLNFNTDWVPIGLEKESPLNLTLDDYSFYNIEGHQGMNYQTAFEEIKQIKEKHQLGFDIMLLSLEELKDNKDLSKAYFNEYVEKNSGLEHKHGVGKGGTFIMVYDPLNSQNVIADFSLPYICCTPKAVVKLSLPASVICAESGRIPFTVFPMNGTVKANVDTKLNGGVEIINGLYFFNPKLVSPELQGQEITFTVNGMPTTCSIKVISQPDIQISVGSVYYPEGVSPATIVNFTITGANFADYIYSWDFLDNGSFVTLKPDKDGNVSYTYYNLSPTKIPTIKVKVNGNGCTQDILIRGWYDAPVKLSLPTSVICSESSPVDFTVFPVDGIVKASAGDGVKFTNGKYSFDPRSVDPGLHGQVITFTVNGVSTSCNITVITQPAVNVSVKSVDYPNGDPTEATVNFIVSGPYFQNYTYSVAGSAGLLKPDTDGNMSYTVKNLDPKGNPTINVLVSNGGCTQTIRIGNWYKPPTVVINSINFPKGNCCDGNLSTVKAEVTEENKNVDLNDGSFVLEGKGSGPADLEYSWFQVDSDTGSKLILDVSNQPSVRVTGLRDYGNYIFQFMVIDPASGAFDTKTVKVLIFGYD